MRLGLIGVLVMGCVTPTSKPVKLYSEPESAAGGVAKLVGDIGTVDGKRVEGNTFELLPGCHTVTNVTEWGGHDHSAAAMVKLPPSPFAMDMKAGHSYVLRIGLQGDSNVTLEATETLNGETTRTFAPDTTCDGDSPGAAGSTDTAS